MNLRHLRCELSSRVGAAVLCALAGVGIRLLRPRQAKAATEILLNAEGEPWQGTPEVRGFFPGIGSEVGDLLLSEFQTPLA